MQNLLSSSLLSKKFKDQVYRTIILPVVLYGCETWSLTLKEKHRLRVFENRVLRRIFGSKREGVTGEWRKLHNEELNDLYCSPKIVRHVSSSTRVTTYQRLQIQLAQNAPDDGPMRSETCRANVSAE